MAFIQQKVSPIDRDDEEDETGDEEDETDDEEEAERLTQIPDFVPSRLIDLGHSVDACPRLRVDIVPSQYPEFEGVENGYVTLSYCWGPPEAAKMQLKMTSKNVDEFRAGIPLETMSPVMRDAVVVCRKLNVRYLWIDALCIMQDSREDWEVESSKLSEIYTKSRFTLCAASSSSCQEGFLTPTPDRGSPRLQIDCTYSADEASGKRGAAIGNPNATGPLLTLRLETRGKAMMEFQNALDRDLAVPDCSWSGRGWTYQEKTLAPRKLIFGRSMVHYIDETMTVSTEGGRWQRITATYGRYTKTDPKARTNPVTLLKSDNRTFYRSLQWQQVVEQYTEMQWTFHADVFPALSGVATVFVQHTPDEWGWEQDEYLAGLWKMDMHCTLLWYPQDRELLPARSLHVLMDSLRSITGDEGDGDGVASFTAPTWSWASRKHPIHFAIARED